MSAFGTAPAPLGPVDAASAVGVDRHGSSKSSYNPQDLSDDEPVLLEVHPGSGIAVITLNTPATRNAMTTDLWTRLAGLLRSVAQRNDTYITILTGRGPYFSSGADVRKTLTAQQADTASGQAPRAHTLARLTAGNMELVSALNEHPHILVAALNGPAIGLSAAIIAHADFIYAQESAWILTPFSTLGLVVEGGASATFPRRMGIAKANDALILGKKLGVNELHQVGFVNKIFPTQPAEAFISSVISYVQEKFQDLDRDAVLITKKLIRDALPSIEPANVREIYAGVDRWETGRPTEQFRRVAEKEKRHKL